MNNITHVTLGEAKNLFKMDVFRWFYILSTVCFIFPHMMNFSFKTIGLAGLKNDAYVTFVGSCGAATNAIVRLVSALAYQKFGYMKIGLAILALEIITAIFYL